MLNILIIEDEIMEAEGLKLILKKYYDKQIRLIQLCFDGLSGLQAAQGNHFDLVFADIEMPALDGLSVIEEIRKFDQKSYIVIVTAYGKFEYAQKAIRLSVGDYLCKPYSIDSIKQIMDGYLFRQTSANPARSLENKVHDIILTGDLELGFFYMELSFFDESPHKALPAQLRYFFIKRLIPLFQADLSPFEYQKLFLQCEAFFFDESIKQLKSESLTLLATLKRYSSPPRNRHPIDCVILQVKQYVLSHYAENVSIDRISTQVSISKYHLCRLFKEKYDMTISHYIRAVRMKKAKLLLQNGKSVSTVASLTGFQDSAYFRQNYRRFFSEAPEDVSAQ